MRSGRRNSSEEAEVQRRAILASGLAALVAPPGPRAAAATRSLPTPSAAGGPGRAKGDRSRASASICCPRAAHGAFDRPARQSHERHRRGSAARCAGRGIGSRYRGQCRQGFDGRGTRSSIGRPIGGQTRWPGRRDRQPGDCRAGTDRANERPNSGCRRSMRRASSPTMTAWPATRPAGWMPIARPASMPAVSSREPGQATCRCSSQPPTSW
jgi:hypothetical protein